MPVRPLGDRIAVRRNAASRQSSGGILFATPREQQEGEVLAVGQRVESVKAGDRVLCDKWAREHAWIDGEMALIAREEDVLGILRDCEFIPLGARVLVERDPQEEWAEHIYLPEEARDRGRQGVVVAHGPGVSVVAGDRVLAPLHAGCDVAINGERYWLMQDTEIFAVLPSPSSPEPASAGLFFSGV